MKKHRLKLVLLGMLISLSMNSFSRTERKSHPKQHLNIHKELLADQVNIHKEINLLDSVSLLYKLKEEAQEFPAIDLYQTWNTQWVNPYKKTLVQLPDSLPIDVKEYCMPVGGKVISNFGFRRHRFHSGIDLKLQTGDTVYAAFSGKVRIVRYDRRGYGYFVVIRHSNGLETLYGHLSKFLVNQDQVVKTGEPIALGGNTGRSTGSHLHFETRLLGRALNPNEIFDFNNQVPHTDMYVFKAGKNEEPKTPKSNGRDIAYHRVKNGDNLSGIASKYRVSVTKLCKLNNITTKTKLQLGQKLRYS